MPGIRAWVNDQLRALARDYDIVVDGRDIGTVVFPDAALKVFLVADPWERARRRLSERLRASADRGGDRRGNRPPGAAGRAGRDADRPGQGRDPDRHDVAHPGGAGISASSRWSTRCGAGRWTRGVPTAGKSRPRHFSATSPLTARRCRASFSGSRHIARWGSLILCSRESVWAATVAAPFDSGPTLRLGAASDRAARYQEIVYRYARARQPPTRPTRFRRRIRQRHCRRIVPDAAGEARHPESPPAPARESPPRVVRRGRPAG